VGEQTSERGAEAAADRFTDRWVPGGRQWVVVPLAIFAASRLISTSALLLLGRGQPAYVEPRAPHHHPRLQSHASYADLVSNWDGHWYSRIVEHGYPSHLPTVHGVVQQNQWAYYPLYPSLVKLATWTGLSYALAASLVSTVLGALAMCVLYRLLAPRLGTFGAAMSVLALCVAPAAVIWQVAYTESLALLLLLLALGSLARRHYGRYLTAVLLLSLTRPVVLPLAGVAAVHWLLRWRGRAHEPFPRREARTSGAAVLLTGASFLIWPAVTGIVTHRPDAYVVTQQAWLHSGASGWPTYLVAVIHASSTTLVVGTVVVLGFLAVVLLRKPAQLWGIEMRAWSALYPLYVLVATVPGTSVVRYGLLCVFPWWPVPEIEDRVTTLRARATLVVVVTVLGIATQVVWLHSLYVVLPGDHQRFYHP